MWFLRIAEHGYGTHATAFFPLYPLLVRVFALGTGRSPTAGVIFSVACFAAALVLLYRLVRDEFDAPTAVWTVILLSFAPTSFFFQAVYSESLFLLLTVACFAAARRGRWVLAGLAGGLAALTRSAGVLLLVPLAWMWFEQYRGGAIRLPGAVRRSRCWRAGASTSSRSRRLRWCPPGLGALHGLPAAAVRQPAGVHGRGDGTGTGSFHLPFVAMSTGAQAAWRSVRPIAADPAVFTRLQRLPFHDQWLTMGNLTAFLALVFALVLLVACWRRLPSAYTVFAVVSLLLPLSYPTHGTPLLSFPRFLLVDFPVFVALRCWSCAGRCCAGRAGGAHGRPRRVHGRLRQRDVGGVARALAPRRERPPGRPLARRSAGPRRRTPPSAPPPPRGPSRR